MLQFRGAERKIFTPKLNAHETTNVSLASISNLAVCTDISTPEHGIQGIETTDDVGEIQRNWPPSKEYHMMPIRIPPLKTQQLAKRLVTYRTSPCWKLTGRWIKFMANMFTKIRVSI
jgi:hypothetical protein